MAAPLEMVSPLKVLWHRDRVAAFLDGAALFPATLEIGVTTACNLACADCPSRRGQPGTYLPVETAERLFALCRGRSFGAILSGGEPTLHPDFGRFLALAREHAFRDVVVISNGSRIDRDEVAGPLLRHASVVRISLYDWQGGTAPGSSPTLRRIEWLRCEIETSGSELQIGVSLLTRGVSRRRLNQAAAVVRAAGAHWLYLHPTCVSTPQGAVRAGGQERLLAALAACRRDQLPGFSLHYLAQRFSSAPVVFNGYHAAHFVMVIGADGANYLSSETKYQPRYRLAVAADYARRGFFSDASRRAAIAAVRSCAYPAGGSRNRGVLYSQVLEEARQGGADRAAATDFLLPHIL